MTDHLFSTIKLGRLTLNHRIAMAPLTRSGLASLATCPRR